jgi:hypothetical protein
VACKKRKYPKHRSYRRSRGCVQNGLYLVDDNGARLALLVHAREYGPFAEVIVDIAGPDANRITSALEEIRRLVSERSVFRGQVIAVGAWLDVKLGGQAPVTFLDRPGVSRSDVILPERDVLKRATVLRRGIELAAYLSSCALSASL